MQQSFQFLKQIKKNNNKEWFEKNKTVYLKAKEEYEHVVQQVLDKLVKFDPEIAGLEASKTTFRIYKDVRFSKDKTPYKVNFGAHLCPGGKNSTTPGYYMHVEPGNSFLGGGCYMPSPEQLGEIRQEIDYNFSDFKKIMTDKNFKKYFANGLSDEGKLVNPPKGYDKENPAVEYLKHKNFAVIHRLPDTIVLSTNYIKYTTDVFKSMQPFIGFLREVIR